MNKKAFTLLELLVVVVVIGLLTAILVPALGKAREGARRAQCINNLRQIGIAWYLYLDENDETFPSSSGWGGKGGNQSGYGILDASGKPLNRYLDVYSENDRMALEVFHCPSDKGQLAHGYTMFEEIGTSYAIYWGGLTLSDTSFCEVSRCALVYEYDSYHGGTVPNAKMNILFMDGHVKMHLVDAEVDNTMFCADPSKPVCAVWYPYSYQPWMSPPP